MVIEQFMSRDSSMSGEWDKVNIGRDNYRFSLEQFNHEFTDSVDGSTIDKNLHCISCKFFFFLTIRDVPGNKVNLKIEAFGGGSSINDGLCGVTMVHSGRQVADESGQEDIIGHSESMSAEENLALGKPCIQ